MTNYEIMFIVKATLDEETLNKIVKDTQALITNNDSKVIEFKEMGRKKLAYPIKKEVSGYYFVMTMTANKDAIKEIDRKASIDENVIRHLIIKLDEE